MKKDIHPATQPVLFIDSSAETQFLIQSATRTDKTATYEADGKEYPVVYVDVSSASHPVYTGKSRVHVKEGRVARFKNKFGHSFST